MKPESDAQIGALHIPLCISFFSVNPARQQRTISLRECRLKSRYHPENPPSPLISFINFAAEVSPLAAFCIRKNSTNVIRERPAFSL